MIAKNTKTNMVLITVCLTLGSVFLYAMNSSIRNNYGIMLNSIMNNAGISFTDVSFVLAVGQLIFGLVQPIFGILASKKGNSLTLVIGALLTLTGILLIPFCKSALSLMICLGFILPSGTGAISFGIIMGAITPKLPEKSVPTVSGIVNASNGIGNTVMSPIINSLIVTGGLLHGMLILAIPSALMIPISLLLGKNKKKAPENIEKKQVVTPPPVDTKLLFENAFKNRTYICLMLGFLTCGFHMALITNHLPTQLTSYGFSSEVAAYAFSIYGITTIIGSILSGSLCGKVKMKDVLGTFYGLRPITILIFLLSPKNMITITLFTAFLGFSGSSTVPPVSGIVGKTFGTINLATLFGFAFFIHQIGGFFGAWLGGICFYSTGSYDLIWIADILLSAMAAIVSFIIRDSKTV